MAIRQPAVSSWRFRAWAENSERQSFNGISGGPLGHHAVHGTDAIELGSFVKFLGEALRQVLLHIFDASCVHKGQDAAAEAAAHHPRTDHLRHPGGELHETVKLSAAYREIEAKTLMRCIEKRAKAAG